MEVTLELAVAGTQGITANIATLAWLKSTVWVRRNVIETGTEKIISKSIQVRVMVGSTIHFLFVSGDSHEQVKWFKKPIQQS